MQRGFTLIEVMVAAVVLSIGCLGVLAMLLTTINNNRIAHDRTVAVTLAEQQLAELEALATNWPASIPSEDTPNLLINLIKKIQTSGSTTQSSWYGIKVDSNNARSLATSGATALNVNGAATPPAGTTTNPSTQAPPGRFYIGFSVLPATTQFPQNEFVRGAIRVTWDRSGATNSACNAFASFDTVNGAPAACEFVTLPFAFHKT